MQKILLLGLILLLQNYTSNAQIDSLRNGLKGKIIRALGKSSTSPSVYYAGLKGNELGSGLIYRSEDAGVTWDPLYDGKPVGGYIADIQAIEQAKDPQRTLYVGTWKNGLFKSVDEGESWQKDMHFPSADIRSIKAGIQNPLLVYAATSFFGVIKSVDGGQTWKRNAAAVVNNSFQFAWSIEIDKNDDNIIYAQTFRKGIWKSSDQGESWKQVLDTNGKVCWDMKVSKDSKEIWVASSISRDTLSAVFHSRDSGDTWEEIPNVPQIGVSQINVLDRNNNKTVAIGSWKNGVFLYKNNKWVKSDHVDFHSIAEILVADDEFLIGSWGNGTYKLKL